MKAHKIHILTLAARMADDRPLGMLVDHKRWPPSNRGEVKHLLRKGYLCKGRKQRGKFNSWSVVYITDAGRRHLERIT